VKKQQHTQKVRFQTLFVALSLTLLVDLAASVDKIFADRKRFFVYRE